MKFGSLIFGALALGGGIALTMPQAGLSSFLEADETGPLPADNSNAEEPAETAGAWAQEITLDRESDGHFYTQVEVEGQSTRMLIDTGASIIALSGKDASALGLHWNSDDIRPVGRGANGPVYGTQITLTSVTLGGFEANNIQAMIIPKGLDISLLGQSFLSKIGRVEISGDQMLLSN